MEAMLDHEVRALLESRRGTWPEIATRCGVSYSWISKFVRGRIPNPGYATLKLLYATLKNEGTATESEVRDAA